jgi:hypothetical protein
MLVAWPAAFGGYQVTCRMMGRVATTCCCGPAHGQRAETSTTAEVRARSCCELSPSTGHDAVPALRGTELRLDAPLLATLAPIVVELPALESRTLGVGAGAARAPPPASAPLFLKHCALLS